MLHLKLKWQDFLRSNDEDRGTRHLSKSSMLCLPTFETSEDQE